MEINHNILSEINGISPAIGAIGNSNIYSVPNRYFDELPGKILTLVKENSSLQKNISNPFQVPSGYFDGLASSILSKIKMAEFENDKNEIESELDEIAPFLNTISRKNIYTVPEFYFQNFSVKKESDQAPAKIINFNSGWRKWSSYAAAAVVAIVAGSAIFFHTEVKKSHNSLAGNYAQIKNINVTESISQISDGDITSYLQTSKNDIVPAQAAEAQDADIQDYIQNSSDDELQEYLNVNAGPGEKN